MSSKRCIAILREVKNKWERRAPLAPEHVRELTAKGIQVLVQPSNKRIFANWEYEEAGAIITEDIRSANTIFGVKEFPKESLLPNKTYVIFSHTIKAQPVNMPFLDYCLERKVRLADYECIRASPSNGGQRLVAFGEYAGYAGAVDCLRAVGERMLTKGYQTPFIGVAQSFMYPSLDAARAAVAAAGDEIKRVGIPGSMAPMTFTVTGTGNVSRGAQKILDLLPVEWVDPDDLGRLVSKVDRDVPQRKLLATVLNTQHLVAPVDSPASHDFVSRDYYDNPEKFRSVFAERYAPYTSVLVNGIYWDYRYPRVMRIQDLRELRSKVPSGFLGVADISCDIEGGIEFLKKSTTIGVPYFVYNAKTDTLVDGLNGEGVFVDGVDNLPTQYPRESTLHFSKCLAPFVDALSLPQGHPLPEEITGAVITDQGKLTDRFTYIDNLRATAQKSTDLATKHDAQADASKPGVSKVVRMDGHLFDSGFINRVLDLVEHGKGSTSILRWNVGMSKNNRSSAKILVTAQDDDSLAAIIEQVEQLVHVSPNAMASVVVSDFDKESVAAAAPMPHEMFVAPPSGKSALVLGSGFVAGPLVDYLVRKGHSVNVASGAENELQHIKNKYGAEVHRLDASNMGLVEPHIDRSSIVVSLLPATMHAMVARSCIEKKTNMVTASYVSPEMRALDQAAKDAGIAILNEVGLDPGIDHMSAMAIISDVQSKGGKITRFESVCGGLPAPEACDNPLGYKFSWNPRGVLSASQNSARFMKKGKLINIDGPDLLSSASPFDLNTAFRLEQLPNRDSMSYVDVYGIPTATTMYRGTLRYKGFSAIMNAFTKLGLLDATPKSDKLSARQRNRWSDVLARLVNLADDTPRDELVIAIRTRMAEAGCDDESIIAAIDALDWLGLTSGMLVDVRPSGSLVDSLCAVLEDKLSYQPGERDMVIMRHDIAAEMSDGAQQRHQSTLIAYGDKDHSAMARTVGLPAGVCTQLLLTGKLKRTGVLVPTTPDIFGPVLDELRPLGINFVDKLL